MPQRLLITGGSGLLAVNWAMARRQQDDVWLGLNRRQIRLEGARSCSLNEASPFGVTLGDTLDQIAPDVIIHTAGMTNVDGCEAAPTEALAVNRDLAQRYATMAYDRGLGFVHISTDHLFDGRHQMLDEDATCLPINSYGHSKWLGERAVLEAHPDALVLRVNFYGWGPSYRPSFSDWILSSLKAATPITLFDNVFFTPLYTGQLIDSAHSLMKLNARGIHHLTASDRISKYDFGMKLAAAFDLDPGLITRGAYDPDAGTPRPLDMSLDNQKLRKALGKSALTTDDGIAALKAEETLHTSFSSIDLDIEETLN